MIRRRFFFFAIAFILSLPCSGALFAGTLAPIYSLLLLDEDAWTGPANLTATAVSPEAVRLMWQDRSSDETGFNIEMKIGESSFAEVLQVGPNVQQCEISAFTGNRLTPQTVYQFRVRAFKNELKTAYSNIASVTTPAAASTPPATPSDLKAVPASDSAIVLSWIDASDNEYLFRIERAIDCGQVWEFAAQVIAGSTNYTDTGLLPNRSYCYRIRTENNQGESSWSGVASSTTLISEHIPNRPLDFQVTYCQSSMPMTLYCYSMTWTDTSSNEDRFELWAGTLGVGISWGLLSATLPEANTESWSICPNKRYDAFRIRSVNTYGASNYSTTFDMTYSGRCGGPIAPPAAPTSLAATPLSENTIRLTWEDALNESEYRIYRRLESDSYSTYVTVPADTTAYESTELAPSTTYYYKVGSWNAGVTEPVFSNEVSATTEATPATPNVPSDFQAAPVPKTSDSIRLTWTDNSANETYFRIQRGLSASGPFEPIDVGANQTAYTDTGLQPCTTYYYRIYAHNSTGPSSTYAQVSAKTAPPPPTGLIASQGTVLNGIFLDWNAVACAAEYNVYELSSQNADWKKLNTAGDVTLNYTNIGPLEPAIYLFYRLSSVDTNGNEGAACDYAVGWGASPIPTAVYASRGTYTDKVQLKWKPVQTCPEGQGVHARYINQYDIEWASTADGTYTKFLTVRINTQAADPAMPVAQTPDPVAVDIKSANNYFPGVTANTRYYFRVRSTYKDDLNCDDVPDNPTVWQSSPTVAAEGWAQSVAPSYLPAPTNVTASDGTSTTKIDVSWSAVSGAASYNVYRGDSTWGPWVKIRNTTATSMSNTTTDSSFHIIPCTGYWYFVKAVSSSGVEGYSSAYDGGFALTDVMTRW